MKQVLLSHLQLDDYSSLQLSILRERLDVVLSYRSKKAAVLDRICLDLERRNIDFDELCRLLVEFSGPTSKTARNVRRFLDHPQEEYSE